MSADTGGDQGADRPAAAPRWAAADGLSGVPETALITLYNRASEAARPDPLLHDPIAVEVVAGLSFPFRERFGRPELSHVIRALQFDREVRQFLRAHPAGQVISLGEGLETGLWRAGDGCGGWVSVDLPEMIELRRRLLPRHPGNELVAASALDPAWTESLTHGQPPLILAQGLLMYFTPAEVEAFFTLLASRCQGARVIFDTIPGWAATSSRGHRQNAAYRMPAQPWGTGRRALTRMLRRCGVEGIRILPAPRGRGFFWGTLYPTVTARLPGLLPMTIAASIAAARPSVAD